MGFEDFSHFGFVGVDFPTGIGAHALGSRSRTPLQLLQDFMAAMSNLHWRFFCFVPNFSLQYPIVQM
jgi:hypothetical protein